MLAIHVSRQPRPDASLPLLITVAIVSALGGAVLALLADRYLRQRRPIDVLTAPAPIRHLTLGTRNADPENGLATASRDVGSSLDAVSMSLSASRTAELEDIVAHDVDVVAGDGTVACPTDYPIKGNGRSGIYHWPGSTNYGQVRPTLCFRSTDAADRAGFRPAAR